MSGGGTERSVRGRYANECSFILGILCLLVVYQHSNWAGGFDIYDFGLQMPLLGKAVSLLLMTVVPSFFLCWGWLSLKYFFSEESGRRFLWKKILQFYPPFILSYAAFLLYNPLPDIPAWMVALGALGLYHQTGLHGGNIFVPVLAVILTTGMLKGVVRRRPAVLPVFACMCLVLAKWLPHENDFFAIKYFGYYAAFFAGAAAQQIGILDMPWRLRGWRAAAAGAVFGVAAVTPVLNALGYRVVELEYNPNSPEQLFLCLLGLVVARNFLTRHRAHASDALPVRFIHAVGNNAYFHFTVQAHVIRMIVAGGLAAGLAPALTQVLVIALTSWIAVFGIRPIYRRLIEEHLSREA